MAKIEKRLVFPGFKDNDQARRAQQNKQEKLFEMGQRGAADVEATIREAGRLSGTAGSILGGGISTLNEASPAARDLRDQQAQFGLGAAQNVRGVAQGVQGLAAQDAAAIRAAAARPETSLAEAQLRDAQIRAQQDALSLAATAGRGGNAALANRQALQALTGQQSQNALAAAQVRAQEEAAIRNSQIVAAQSAGQLGLQAGQVGVQGGQIAGALGLGGLGGAAATNTDLTRLGTALTGTGLSGQLSAAGLQGGLASGLFEGGTDAATDIGIAQLNAELGFGSQQIQKRAANQALALGAAEQVARTAAAFAGA